MKSLQARGRATALDNMPELDSEGVQIWNMYAAVGSGGIIALDIYATRVGLPIDWTFEECLSLISEMSDVNSEIDGDTGGGKHIRH